MFEKEARKYAEAFLYKGVAEASFIKGAEFGYNKAMKEIGDKQLTKAKEIIREYSKWECEYCDYKRNPDYATMHCSQCQTYPLHKKAVDFLNSEVEK